MGKLVKTTSMKLREEAENLRDQAERLDKLADEVDNIREANNGDCIHFDTTKHP